jgi:DNA-binding MarR family transcriptional regulator
MNNTELTKIVLDWSSLVVRLSMHDLNRYARATGLSLAQINVLLHLYYKGPREVMEFADFMQVSPAGASQMVERLVQQGLVRRVETTEDRRVRLVHLTDEGQQLVMESIAARRQWVGTLVALLTPEESETVGQGLSILGERAAQLETTSETGVFKLS